jgi:hypothetical protein
MADELLEHEAAKSARADDQEPVLLWILRTRVLPMGEAATRTAATDFSGCG